MEGTSCMIHTGRSEGASRSYIRLKIHTKVMDGIVDDCDGIATNCDNLRRFRRSYYKPQMDFELEFGFEPSYWNDWKRLNLCVWSYTIGVTSGYARKTEGM